MAGGVQLNVTFSSPLLPTKDWELLSRQATYVTMRVASLDGRDHAVQLYLDSSAEHAVIATRQQVVWQRVQVAGMVALSTERAQQDYFDPDAVRRLLENCPSLRVENDCVEYKGGGVIAKECRPVCCSIETKRDGRDSPESGVAGANPP